MVLGLALGSGGARGWCHIGVLRALEEQGLRPDVIAGCSMGALVGAAWAADRLDALEDWALSLTQTRFLQYLDLSIRKGGLVQGRAVQTILHEIGLPERIEDLKHPYLAVCTDMATGREVWLQKGPLIPAIRASIAIPGVFSPQEMGGRWMLDGGLVNPVPMSGLRALGATTTVAVNPNARTGHALWKPQTQPDIWKRLAIEDLKPHLPDQLISFLGEGPTEKSPDYIDVVNTSIDIMIDYVRKTREAADPPHLKLDADLQHISVLELYRAQEAIEEGHRIAQGAADRIASDLS
ncbi:patatin-like phospholipase family protein [Pacificoceanicola onchidii]|uniref:patatin-like phospholipase family protein n=1 Tax=Pacificoceanicola onchidii TaxID=2562685 RepID=UPI0010A62A54|nr:patatin-like phospholipase family protein [Pacificoceanicola onchidii]